MSTGTLQSIFIDDKAIISAIAISTMRTGRMSARLCVSSSGLVDAADPLALAKYLFPLHDHVVEQDIQRYRSAFTHCYPFLLTVSSQLVDRSPVLNFGIIW